MTVHSSPLGKASEYVSHYSPELLHPIARQLSREPLGVQDNQLPFQGEDVWNGYELSWLNDQGKPQVAMAEFRIPCQSPNIVESKSFKLYLNSFNQTRFVDWSKVEACLRKDLSSALGIAPERLGIQLMLLREAPEQLAVERGICLDELDVTIDQYHPQPDYLQVRPGSVVEEQLFSQLLKSNCPVTGQPDWATLVVRYRGAPIDHEGLLRYIVSFREHQDFHEHCVERMFCDIQRRCQPEQLSVYARYTRRGGLDINPYRSTQAEKPDNCRWVRQ